MLPFASLQSAHLKDPDGCFHIYLFLTSSSRTFPLPLFPRLGCALLSLFTARKSLMSCRVMILSHSTTSCVSPFVGSAYEAVRCRKSCLVLYELSKGFRSVRTSKRREAMSSCLAAQRRSRPLALGDQQMDIMARPAVP